MFILGTFFPGNTMRLVFFVRFQSDYTHRELARRCDWLVGVPGSLSLFASGRLTLVGVDGVH